MNRSSRQAFYATVLLLASVIAFGVASPSSLGNEPSSYVYDVRIEANRDTVKVGESFTATVYLYNPGDRDILLEPIRQCTLSGNSVHDPEPVSCVVNIDYVAGAKIRIGAHDKAVFLQQVFTPQFPGPFRVTCLGAIHTVSVTGAKAVTLDYPGVSLEVMTNQTSYKGGDTILVQLVIRNINPYPVKVPVFEKFSKSLTPMTSPQLQMYIEWRNSYFTVESNSYTITWTDTYTLRPPVFTIYYYVDGHQASLRIEVEK